MGLAYFSSNVEGATVYVDDFQLVAPYEATSMALDTSYFEDQFARLATLPNYVQSIDYSWSVVASDGTMDGWVNQEIFFILQLIIKELVLQEIIMFLLRVLISMETVQWTTRLETFRLQLTLVEQAQMFWSGQEPIRKI